MERSTDYAALLGYTYADRQTETVGTGAEFRFIIRNPERTDGDLTVTASHGTFRLSFYSMDEDMGSDFGELVAFIDELLMDESMIFELHAGGEYLLGGSRGVDEFGRLPSRAQLLRVLADGDPCLLSEIAEMTSREQCFLRLRGFRACRCRTLLLTQ